MLLGGRFRTSLTDWLICFETAAVSRSQYVERKKRWIEREKELLDLRRNNLPSATRPGNLDFNGNMFTSRTWPSWKSHIWIAYFIFSRECSPSPHRESSEGCWFPKKNKDQAFPYKHFFPADDLCVFIVDCTAWSQISNLPDHGLLLHLSVQLEIRSN